jgi:hypothetical protein
MLEPEPAAVLKGKFHGRAAGALKQQQKRIHR